VPVTEIFSYKFFTYRVCLGMMPSMLDQNLIQIPHSRRDSSGYWAADAKAYQWVKRMLQRKTGSDCVSWDTRLP
jgi:hypothetical protein